MEIIQVPQEEKVIKYFAWSHYRGGAQNRRGVITIHLTYKFYIILKSDVYIHIIFIQF